MTGEEFLFLVWAFLGFLFLAYTIHYIRRQRIIERCNEFVIAMTDYKLAVKRLAKAFEAMGTIHWKSHINIPEAYRTTSESNEG